MFNPKEPLFLPKGSIRAIISLFVIGFALFTENEKAIELAGLVLAYYFVTRSQKT